MQLNIGFGGMALGGCNVVARSAQKISGLRGGTTSFSQFAVRASDVFPHLRLAPLGALFFALALMVRQALLRWVLVGGFFISPVWAVDDIRTITLEGAKFAGARDAVVEAVEAAGLVVTATIPFNQMLARTAGDLGKRQSPFSDAVVVQFCSARLAWQLVEEEGAQLALCPMSIVVFERVAEPGKITLAYRTPGRATEGRTRGDELLHSLAARAAELVRLGW